MYTFLLALLIIDSLVLVAAVLIQSGKGGGLASQFGGVSTSTDSLFGTRQAGNVLTKTSWWGGGIFLFLAFVLALASARNRVPTSVLDKAVAPTPASAPAPRGATPALPLGTPAPAAGSSGGATTTPAGTKP
ncbi:MAG: hypothetical protein NVS1B4_06260 [Gemmatimonadaceae bacterium]